MSIKEVIDSAAALGGWKVAGLSCFIRREGKTGTQCPVSSLRDTQSWNYGLAAVQLGLSRVHALRIAQAADERGDQRCRLIRRYMLKRFGLAEAVAQ